MNVLEPGHHYELEDFETGEFDQDLMFIQKEKDGDGNLVTVSDGTSNEEVIRVLLDRMDFLNNKAWCEENDEAISSLRKALGALERRTADRQERGVEGTPAE